MNQELRQKIESFLGSFGDEPLDLEELNHLFFDANTLLREVLEDDDEPKYIVPKDYVNFYLENTQQWCSTLGKDGGEAAVFTKKQAEELVKSEREKYHLHGIAGPYAVKLVPIQKQLVE